MSDVLESNGGPGPSFRPNADQRFLIERESLLQESKRGEDPHETTSSEKLRPRSAPKSQAVDVPPGTQPTTVDAELAYELSSEDECHLAEFEVLRRLLRDRVRTVAMGLQTGAYIVGRPGSSKSHTVCEELDNLEVPYVQRNAKMTAPGLWNLLQEHPECVIVLDDIPSLVSEKPALQILMAALDGKQGKPRVITYTTGEVDGRRSFVFHGGIIAISNVPLRRDPLADAVQSRVPLLEHEPSDEMLAAFMRAQAIRGYEDLTPRECLEVVEFAIAESKACEYRLDLRLMRKAWGDYRLWKAKHALSPWQELVRSSLKKTVPGGTINLSAGREDIKEKERHLAARLLQQYPNEEDAHRRNDEWFELTGKSFHTLLRYGRELKSKGIL